MCKKIRCVYRFLDKNKEVLYVGKTVDLDSRLNVHKNLPTGKIEKYELTKFIEFIEFETDLELELMERYFISVLKPKYNVTHKEFKMDKIDNFRKYTWKSYDKKINFNKKSQQEIELENLMRKDKIHLVNLNLFEVLFDLTISSMICDLEEYTDENTKNYSDKYYDTLISMEEFSTQEKLLQYFKKIYPNLSIDSVIIEIPLDNNYPLSLYNTNVEEVILNVYVSLEYEGKNKNIETKIKIFK